MKKCYCGFPETYETIKISKNNAKCNLCFKKKQKSKIDYSSRLKKLKTYLKKTRNKNMLYDCIVPFSGGKDSTFQLYYIVTQLKLKPLVVQFNHGFFRENLKNNNEKTFKKLGVDFISFTPNWKLVKQLMKVSFERKGDFCWHCHTGVATFPLTIAKKFNVDLIFYGEEPNEYTDYFKYGDFSSDLFKKGNNKLRNYHRVTTLGIAAKDMQYILKYENNSNYTERDFWPFMYPKETANLLPVYLGSFIEWDTKKQVEIIKRELDWQGDEVEGMPPNLYDYEKIECHMQGMRDYLKYLKRGYSRVTQMTAKDVKENRMSQIEARKIVSKYEGKVPHSLNIFLDYMGYTKEEFFDKIKNTVIKPWSPNLNTNEYSNKPKDFDKWFKEKKTKN